MARLRKTNFALALSVAMAVPLMAPGSAAAIGGALYVDGDKVLNNPEGYVCYALDWEEGDTIANGTLWPARIYRDRGCEEADLVLQLPGMSQVEDSKRDRDGSVMFGV